MMASFFLRAALGFLCLLALILGFLAINFRLGNLDEFGCENFEGVERSGVIIGGLFGGFFHAASLPRNWQRVY